jgi:hypothetical protein
MGIERAWVQDNQSFKQKKGTLRAFTSRQTHERSARWCGWSGAR